MGVPQQHEVLMLISSPAQASLQSISAQHQQKESEVEAPADEEPVLQVLRWSHAVCTADIKVHVEATAVKWDFLALMS